MRLANRPWRATLVALLLLAATTAVWASERAAAAPPTPPRERVFCEERLGGELWARTELYFGRSRASGPDVTEVEFQQFIDEVVTPRFPDGLTLVDARGQFRGAGGVIIQEPAKLLILFYPWNGEANRAIDQIRRQYVRAFAQQAVLRVDASSCVSF